MLKAGIFFILVLLALFQINVLPLNLAFVFIAAFFFYQKGTLVFGGFSSPLY